MLSTDERRLYSDCFQVPAGYVFDCAVGTTFTVDLEALLFVPIALSSSTVEEPEVVLRDPVALLEAIHRVGERLTLFCEDGRANAPALRHPLLSLMEDSFVPVRAPGDGPIFHPKVWLVRFRHRAEGTLLMRAVVLSRNLTGSRCWDTLVRLDGVPNPKQRVPESQDLAVLVRALPGLASREPLSDARRQQVEELAADAERTPFLAPEPFDTESRVAFLALGTGNRRMWRPEQGDRLLGISPFLSDDALQWLAKLAPRRMLVSRSETLDTCGRDVLAEWQSFGLQDAAVVDADAEAVDEATDQLYGLHAKALAIESGRTTTWWLGSANLTSPVKAGTNVELLIRLDGRTKDVGIERFLEGGFQALLRPYDPSSIPASLPPDEAGSLVEKAHHAVVRADLRGQCLARDSGEWSLALSGHIGLPESTRLDVWPLTVPQGHARQWRGEPLEFRALAVETLTAFFVFRIEATAGGRTVARSFTCKLPVSNLPEDRIHRIVRGVISTRSDLFGYLKRVLAGLDGPAVESRGSGTSTRDTTERGGSPGMDAVLLENIVRALRRSPERIAAIDRTIERLRGGTTQADGQSVIPSELLDLWSTVRELVPVPAAQDGAFVTAAGVKK